MIFDTLHMKTFFKVIATIIAALAFVLLVAFFAKDTWNYIVNMLSNTFSVRNLLSYQAITFLLIVQVIWMVIRSKLHMMPIKPIWGTIFTFTLYIALAQWTQNWLNNQIDLGKYYDLVAFCMILLFVWAAWNGPKGEIAKAQIGRLEWFGSPFMFNIVLGQGNALLPHTFGYEVLERRVIQVTAMSLELMDSSRSNGTINITNWFRVVNPSRLDELDLEKQVLVQIYRIYESVVRNWARTVSPDQFIGRDGYRPLEEVEARIRAVMATPENRRTLEALGLVFEATAASDPKPSKEVNKSQNLLRIMKELMQDDVLKYEDALDLAPVMSGDAQMVIVKGNGSKKNNNAVIADVDEDDGPTGGKGKRGGKGGLPSSKDTTKLSDPPKSTPSKATKIILFIWVALTLITFVGWGKNGDAKKKGQVTAKEVAAKVVAFKEAHKDKLAPPYTKQFKIVLILKDKGDKNWITSKKLDVEGLPDTDKEGWVWNKWEGYQRAEVEMLSFPDDRIADAIVELALDTGDIVTYEKKGLEWYMLYGDTKSRVAYMPHIKRCVRFRVKILNPDPENLATVTVHREWSLKQ